MAKGYEDTSTHSVALSYLVCYAMYEGDYEPSLRDVAVEFMKKMNK